MKNEHMDQLLLLGLILDLVDGTRPNEKKQTDGWKCQNEWKIIK